MNETTASLGIRTSLIGLARATIGNPGRSGLVDAYRAWFPRLHGAIEFFSDIDGAEDLPSQVRKARLSRQDHTGVEYSEAYHVYMRVLKEYLLKKHDAKELSDSEQKLYEAIWTGDD